MQHGHDTATSLALLVGAHGHYMLKLCKYGHSTTTASAGHSAATLIRPVSGHCCKNTATSWTCHTTTLRPLITIDLLLLFPMLLYTTTVLVAIKLNDSHGVQSSGLPGRRRIDTDTVGSCRQCASDDEGSLLW